MSTKIKSLFLATFLVISIGLKAQEAGGGGYEFAVVEGYTHKSSVPTQIAITKSSEVERIELSKGSEAGTILLQKIEELSKQGWQVYNTTNTTLGYHLYFLRRKIK